MSSYIIICVINLDANVQSDVKINMVGTDKDRSGAACRRSGLCGSEAVAPSLPNQALTLQALQELMNNQKNQNVAKDTATILINGIPVKIPLGK